MDLIEKTLTGKSVGKILDVATCGGNFIDSLIKNLADYDEVVGIDINDKDFDEGREEYKDKPVTFVIMDATNMEYKDDTFDIVGMSAGIHHLKNIDSVLSEMKRVLKPGGWFIIQEMFHDNQTEKQMSDVYNHHWSAKISRLLGRTHNPTLKKQEIIDLAVNLGLKNIKTGEYHCTKCDPEKDGKMEDEIKDIDKQLDEVKDFPEYEELKKEGEFVRQYIKKHGYDCATQLHLIATK
jgi:SAM-dependent methyltransferase